MSAKRQPKTDDIIHLEIFRNQKKIVFYVNSGKCHERLDHRCADEEQAVTNGFHGGRVLTAIALTSEQQMAFAGKTRAEIAYGERVLQSSGV